LLETTYTPGTGINSGRQLEHRVTYQRLEMKDGDDDVAGNAGDVERDHPGDDASGERSTEVSGLYPGLYEGGCADKQRYDCRERFEREASVGVGAVYRIKARVGVGRGELLGGVWGEKQSYLGVIEPSAEIDEAADSSSVVRST